MKTPILAMIILVFLSSCTDKKKDKRQKEMEEKTFQEGSFGFDAEFLKERDTSLLTLTANNSRILISPKYQAKVFTSSSSGDNGRSYGWINYDAFDKEDEHMNAYGGENRFWLGPEGSKFSLFFKPNSEMIFENWKTPPSIDIESWEVEDYSDKKVTLVKEMTLLNYADSRLEIDVKREIEILEKTEIEALLNIELDSIESVGFSTNNTIKNVGDFAWTEETGAPCIWILDMFTPSDETVIFIPYKDDLEGRIATTDYFGEISEDRINYEDGELFFKADGKSRGKLGIAPERATTVAGSYDAKNKVLTITTFDVDNDAIYLNQEWTSKKDPLKGDAVNAYNDGPLEDGSQMGPFYEIESVSPAAFLEPSEKINHNHNVFHFTGDEKVLDEISQQVLGVSLNKISSAFKNN
ncbi:DUF6786 family protein [Salegentibacter sp. T436]|uniref:DUF6786 family protein n=1 Tax=Salegentibacter sp. T436 TaxID=1729720 RepID=UPI00094A7838|nr:DUF6786 family protein [Salegentibacter sp. T436]APS40561.1 hypothetical protein AO058_17510 [Salegentibacter sp. T436]|tara:strand:+ start:299 stop:1528 length:1230 start_codon:yes stop_codon:yes gene_type:complete